MNVLMQPLVVQVSFIYLARLQHGRSGPLHGCGPSQYGPPHADMAAAVMMILCNVFISNNLKPIYETPVR